MISSSWFLFHERIVKTNQNLEKNSYPLIFVDEQVKFFDENKMNNKIVTDNSTNDVVKYCKSPSIGHFLYFSRCQA